MNAGDVHALGENKLTFLYNAFTQPGTLHILGNALQESLESLDMWDAYIDKLRTLTKLLGSPSWKELILEMLEDSDPSYRLSGGCWRTNPYHQLCTMLHVALCSHSVSCCIVHN